MKENLSDEEYIIKLEKILAKEKSNEYSEDEEIELSINDKEIQEQQKEIESLEKEINLLKKQNNNNIAYISNNEINNNFKNILQKKLMYEIELKLNKFLDEYDKNVVGQINQMGKDIKQESEKNINEQFNIVLKEINQNNTKFENDCINKQNKIIENINIINQKLNININNIEEKDLDDSINSLSKKSSKNIGNEDNLIYQSKYNSSKGLNKGINLNSEDSNKNFSSKNSSETENYLSNSKKNVNRYLNKKKDNQKGTKGEENNIKTNIFSISNKLNNPTKLNYNKQNNNIDINNEQKNIKKKSNKSNNAYNIDKNNNNNQIINGEENINDEDNEYSFNSINDSKNYFNKSKKDVNNNRQNNNYQNEKNNLLDTKNIKKPIVIKNSNLNNINNVNNINNSNNANNSNKDNKDKMIPLAQEINNPNKQRGRRAFNIVSKVFFEDNQEKFIKVAKISEFEKDEIEREAIREMKEGKGDLKDYCKNYIEVNVLPLFKRKDLEDNQREILKYNIEVILKCIGEDKKLYKNAYHPEVFKNKTEIDRRKSIDALRKFRKEFQISEKDYNDEGIIQRLAENDFDIYKTFGKIFGI